MKNIIKESDLWNTKQINITKTALTDTRIYILNFCNCPIFTYFSVLCLKKHRTQVLEIFYNSQFLKSMST